MSQKDKVFVSYSHKFEEKTNLVEKIEDYCKENASFEIIREKGQVNPRESFYQYMKKIGRGWQVLLILSDDYFQSENCLLELIEIDKNHGIGEQRIISIFDDDYRCDDSETISKHIDFWKNKETKFPKEKLSKELISKTCHTNKIIYSKDEGDFHDLVTDIEAFIEAKRKEEKVQREKGFKLFRQQCIDEIAKQQEDCHELNSSIEKQIENFPPFLETLSPAQLKSSFSGLCIATENALKQTKEETTTQAICRSAMQIFNNLMILSFDDQHFTNRQICFDGEIRLLYKVPFTSQTLVEGYMACEYNFPVRLKNTSNNIHGEPDLSEVAGLQNGWGLDDKAQKYKDIHKAVGAGGTFSKEDRCFKELSDYIAYLRDEKIENYYFSVSEENSTHHFNQSPKIVDQLQEDIPAIAVVYYGVAVDDVLIMQENDVKFPINRFFNLIEKYQNHANNQSD